MVLNGVLNGHLHISFGEISFQILCLLLLGYPFFFFFLAALHSMWSLCSQTRDGTRTPSSESAVLTTGLPWKSPGCLFVTGCKHSLHILDLQIFSHSVGCFCFFDSVF